MGELILPDKMNHQIDAILGMMNFQTGRLARLFRDAGMMEIPTKCEREQSHILFMMLKLYGEHGDAWGDIMEQKISQAVSIVEKIGAEKEVQS